MIFYQPSVDFNQASLLFGALRKADPYRLTNMDIYSNVLFVLVSELITVVCVPLFPNSHTPTFNQLRR